jgi:AraC family transcriptional activator of pobA
MTDLPPQRIQSIAEFHRLRGLPVPVHPMVSVLRFEDMKQEAN